MPWSWPVEVNCHEATAYTVWLTAKTGKYTRLPTEDESYYLFKESNFNEDVNQMNVALTYASSTPVNYFKHGDFYDIIGNVWQWTRTPMYPFNDFQCHPIYDDFTIPTFDDQHNLFKGGSWVSCGNLASTFSRYAFRRHFYQFAGFRTV
jgi:formylglycine-generating enzyme required for sulfatase activity